MEEAANRTGRAPAWQSAGHAGRAVPEGADELRLRIAAIRSVLDDMEARLDPSSGSRPSWSRPLLWPGHR